MVILRALELGPRVVTYRAIQAARLLALKGAGFWGRLEARHLGLWTERAVDAWQKECRAHNPDAWEALQLATTLEGLDVVGITQWAREIRGGTFRIFDSPIDFDLNRMSWDRDWRHDHRWPPAYFGHYRLYERGKVVPYDVKFPWELSRFSFLLPLITADALEGGDQGRKVALHLLADWERANPVAHSVNWHPMEVSMRLMNLALVARVLGGAPGVPGVPAVGLEVLLRQIALHGEFLERNLEYTDVRGNHYTANLVALLLAGLTLGGVYAPARRWLRPARRRIAQEIALQYCEDGVNFEKSTAYHRLVTELFLVAMIVLREARDPLPPEAVRRLRAACDYTCAYLQPDGLAPAFGDDDSARVIGFEPKPVRDQRPLLALAAAAFGEPRFKAAAEAPSAAIAWLLGKAGVETWQRLGPAPTTSSRFFEAGGMAVSRHGGNHLVADFGEVGNAGRGGHGHNDTFGFTLCLGGRALIVDPGSPTYTGDLATYEHFRSTPRHNTLAVDGEELARLLGVFRIAADANPEAVVFESGEDCDVLSGRHAGYGRLSDPVIHTRRLRFWKREGRLLCEDDLACSGAHRTARFLHFAPGIDTRLRGSCLELRVEDQVTIVRWDGGASARIERELVSRAYGHTEPASVLLLENHIRGGAQLHFEIAAR